MYQTIFFPISWLQSKNQNIPKPNSEEFFLYLTNTCFDKVFSLFLTIVHVMKLLINAIHLEFYFCVSDKQFITSLKVVQNGMWTNGACHIGGSQNLF